MSLTILIMAGGKGTRFWPISTEEKPKQFLNLIDEQTMIQKTVERLTSIVDLNHIFICTGKKYVSLVKKQLPYISNKNIIIEPKGKNTAPCILLSSIYINQIYQNSEILVLPSDHIINNVDEFINVIKSSNAFLKKNKKAIITIGISPNKPETAYGYINFKEQVEIINDYRIMKVNKFVEKPNKKVAEKYLKDGSYLWNAGMFMFNSINILNEFKKYYISYNELIALPPIDDKHYYEELDVRYSSCEPISIDYAIMEKSENIYVVPANFGWDDIGSWKAIERYIESDKNNNRIKGNVKQINSKNNIVYGNNNKIILFEAEDIFCVDAGKMIIIGKKEKIERIHELRSKYGL